MDKVVFKVNGQEYQVGCEVSSEVTLLDYVRETLELRGTKYMCREAGCGACIVSARQPSKKPYAINSCMIPIVACHGLEITTIEEIGNKKKGYHVLQTSLAENNGSQCGHCSPGWVMTMYSLLKGNPYLTKLEIEQSLSSNICRCTGYRPILETFKKFAEDATQSEIKDIEDLNKCKISEKNCKEECDKNENGWCFINKYDATMNSRIKIKLKDGKIWYRVQEVKDVFKILNCKGCDSYMLVGGNTAKGAYPIEDYPQILIDINGVSELKGYKFDQNLIIGAGETLTELLNIFANVAKKEYFGYLQKLHDHLEKVAHVAVRNVGTIAGNLMIKHKHNFFSSDIYLLFETVGAQLTLATKSNAKQIVTMQQFLKMNMKGVVILNVMLPPLSKKYEIITFKIMPRRLNAHAIVNAGFLFKLCKNNTVLSCRIVYGGLSSSFNRAYKTETYLVGKGLFTNDTLQSAIKVLDDELEVQEELPEPTVEYRRKTALALFYKALLTICPDTKIHPRYRSAASQLHDPRPVSQARQVFDTDPSMYPLNQPIPKIDGLYQCAGEAFYSEDLPFLPREVFAAFTLTTVATGNIVSIDPKEAVSQPGVVAFFSAKDIPGINSFLINIDNYQSREELFCSDRVGFFNQPFGVIVAETKFIAEQASKLVKVEYKNVKLPIIDVKDAIKHPERVKPYINIPATEKGNDVERVIKGNNTIYGQIHFTMENLVCVIHPIEEGLKVYAATHHADALHISLSKALNIDQSRIDVYVRRVGGSYGLKVTRNIQSAVACGLVVQKLNRPCRFIQSLTSTSKSIGKRTPFTVNFELGTNNIGVVQYMSYKAYQDFGHTISEFNISKHLPETYDNCYNKSRWNFESYSVITDTPKNSWFRAPGSLEGVSNAKLIMEQISYELGLDPITVRLNNLDRNRYKDIEEMYNTLKNNSTYDQRRSAVDKFNTENRWRKRGLRYSFMRFAATPAGKYNILLSVYQGDGTVVLTHGAVDIGQGINTKAAQVCAYLLDISIDKIQVKGSDSVSSPNSDETAASVGSQNINIGIQKCCQELLKRLDPLRQKMDNPSWEVLVKEAYAGGIDLQTQSYVSVEDSIRFPYAAFGVALAEVEIDVLTGEMEILRVDLLEDVGKSVSPAIDVGQVEGAFIMGVGYWTSEKITYAQTGEVLTNRTWNYHVPLCTDIPQDFRVYFRKKSYSYDKFLGAKAVGEPPLCLSICVPLALREAISEARYESGIPRSQWFPIDGPSTVDVIALSAATNTKDFKFN